MTSSIDPQEVVPDEADRGRLAQRPSDIAWRGWWDVLWRVKDQLDEDNVSIVAAGLALYGLLAVFPSLAAAVAIYGLVASPEAIQAQMQTFGGMLPAGTIDILQRKSTLRRNYPILAHFRYGLESIGPEMRQYFIESDTAEVPFSR